MVDFARPASVFVVDDDLGLLRLIEKTLQREGYTVATAGSGQEAIRWMEENGADLILMDLDLPDMPGQILINQLAAKNRSAPFIVITGHGDERVAVQMMKQGAIDYLVKDRDFLEFVPAVVHRALRQVESQRRLAAAEEALKKEHAFITAVLDTSGALVVVIDPSGRIVRFNRACESVTGYAAHEAHGQIVWDIFIPPEDRDKVKRVFDSLCAGNFPNEHENHWLARDGEKRLIAWSNSALLNSSGRVEFIVATGIDITERRRLEMEIIEVSGYEQRRIGQDLHDGICQQLAGIELVSQVLEQNLEAEKRPEAAQAGRIAHHVRDAISQTRLLARGLLPVELEAEGLGAALEDLASNTRDLFQVDCTFRCEKQVPIHDPIAATHLYRIAQEAINNAVRHGKAGQILVELSWTASSGALTITDNGSGFPKRLKKTDGLGLRIMRYRAGMIGGTFDIARTGEKGTCVSVAFPIHH